MVIKAVLIDIDNTILDFNKSAEISIINTAKHYGIILPEDYFEVFLRVNDLLWKKLENGEIIKQDIYNNRFNMIFGELGISFDGPLFEEAFRKEMRNTAIPVEGAKELLSYLSEKYAVYTASNASRLQQETRLKKNGFDKYISGMFTSEELGFQKPAKEFFALCCEAIYPITPSEIIVIGDSVDADIIGAKNFGLKTIWFNFNNITYETYSFTDYHVNSLSEIKTIL
ncbi:MAG: YjjG family noncanonical pyrimidine nucleotidase [Clostridia bacterium]|nr:YjjG family noncanonical pyrimidine nucleotidase [Clostridia bacterium]